MLRVLIGSFLALWVMALTLRAAPPPGYYDSATNASGAALRQALHRLLTNAVVIPYSSTRLDTSDALKVLDEDPQNTNNVLCVYSRLSEPKSTFGLTNGWNREHLWCNSYGIDSSGPAYSDLHNLRAEDENVNSSRGNKFYDLSNPNSPGYRNPGFPEAPLTTTDNDSWEPPEEVKGDIARALFYMDVRYEGDRTNERDLSLTERTLAITSTTNLMGRLSTLLSWHRHDPVSADEMLRNDKVEQLYQHNRNPFIDHPEWVREVFSGPQLTLSGQGGQLRLAWSAQWSNAVLETAYNLPLTWTNTASTPALTNGECVVFISRTNAGRFYRLRMGN